MPPFSIAEFADLVSSALALEDDLLHARFGQNKWDVGNGLFQFQPESPITRARRNAFDLSTSQRPSTPTSSLILPASAPSLLSLPEPERSLARSLSPSLNCLLPSSSIPSAPASSSSSAPPVDNNNNHAEHNLSKSNSSSGSSPFFSPHKPKTIKFHNAHFEKQKKYKSLGWDVKGAPAAAGSAMLLAPPASDPAILGATMSTVDLGANCLSSLGGGGTSSSASSSAKARRASATGTSLRAGLGLGLSGTPVESGWERNAMDAPGSIGRGIKGKLLPRISISGGSMHSSSALTAPSSPVSPTSPGQGQGPMKLFAKLKRQLSKNNVRPNPSASSSSSNPSPTGLLFPFPSTSIPNPNNDLENAFIEHGLAPAPAPNGARTLRHSHSVTFAASLPPTPTRASNNNHARSDSYSDWEIVRPPSGSVSRSASKSMSSLTSASASASSDSDGTVGSGRGKKRRNRKRRARKGSKSPPAPKAQLQLQPQEECDTSPSLYSCESAPRSIIGSSGSFFLGLEGEEKDKLTHSHRLTLPTQEDARSIATSTSTAGTAAGELEYAPYLPLIIQHERLQAKLRMPVPFSAVEGVSGAEDYAQPPAGSSSPFASRSRKTSGRGRERKRTLSGTSRGQGSTSASTSSTSTSTSAKPKLRNKRSSARPLPPPLTRPPPASPPPACPPSPSRASPPPRRASAPVTHPQSQSHSHSQSHPHPRSRTSQPQSQRGRATSPFSVSSRASSLSRESRESRDSVDSRGPVTPCTPFFTASEGSSVVVAGSGMGSAATSVRGSGSMRSSVDSGGVGLDVPAAFDEEEGVGLGGGIDSEIGKEKYSAPAQPVSPSSRSRSSYSHSNSNIKASGARRSLSPTSTSTGTSKRLQRAASPTPLVTLTRSRSRQTLAANAGPASPPPSGPLPPPPAAGERERKERARHSTPAPSVAHTELYASRRGSLAPSTQPSSASASDWPLHHHPSLIGLSALSTPDSRSFYASAPPSPTSVRGASASAAGGGVGADAEEDGGRRASLGESMDMYLSSSSSTSSELQKLYQQGGQMMATSSSEMDIELESSSISEYYSHSEDPSLHLSRPPSLTPSEEPDQVTDLDLKLENTYIQRQQRQHHLLSRLRGHLPCPSNASASTCDTSAEAAAALLAANTRANAGVGVRGGRKIGVGRQQVYVGAGASAGGRRGTGREGLELEWTLGLGLDADSASASASQGNTNTTHVCASGVTPDTTPVAPPAPTPSFVVSAQQQFQHQQHQQHQGMRKAGLGANKTSLPSSASRPSSGFLLDSADLSGSPGARERCKSESAARFRSASGGRRGKEDWTLSLPGHVPQEWAKKVGDGEVAEEKSVNSNDAANTTFNGNSNARHSAPILGAPQGVVITVEDVDDPERLEVDPGLRMSMIRSSITSDPRVGEIVLCVPRVVSSGSGIEDVVMDESTVRSSSLQMSKSGEEREEGDGDVEPRAEDPVVEHKERVKANAKANLAKLEALSADLARFNEMLRSSGAPSSSHSHSRSRAHASMPVPARDLRHAKSCGVLEVDEPPPKNAVLRMPSVEVFMRDDEDLTSVLDMSEEEDEEEKEKEAELVERTPPQVVLSPVLNPESPAPTSASRPVVARLSATSLASIRPTRSTTSLSSPTTPSPTTPSRIRAPLPFAPFPPPTSFAPSKARKPEVATAGMNTGNGVSGVLASGIFGSSVSAGARPLGKTLSTSTGRGVPTSASAAGPSTSVTSKPVLKLQTVETSIATSTVRPGMARRTSVSSMSSSSTMSTATVATAAFPSSMLVPSPMLSPLETPMASAFPAPPPLSYPSLAAAVVGGRANSSTSTSKPQKKETERPSTTSSETSVSSVGTDETIIPSVEQRMRMRLGLLGSGLLGSVDSDHEREGTDEESMYSGTYYSARSSFSSEAR